MGLILVIIGTLAVFMPLVWLIEKVEGRGRCQRRFPRR